MDVEAHTVLRRVNGEVQVQHYGEGHVVEGSEIIIDVPPGVTVVVRHLPDPWIATDG